MMLGVIRAVGDIIYNVRHWLEIFIICRQPTIDSQYHIMRAMPNLPAIENHIPLLDYSDFRHVNFIFPRYHVQLDFINHAYSLSLLPRQGKWNLNLVICHSELLQLLGPGWEEGEPSQQFNAWKINRNSPSDRCKMLSYLASHNS